MTVRRMLETDISNNVKNNTTTVYLLWLGN
jgi:hypothetical protein